MLNGALSFSSSFLICRVRLLGLRAPDDRITVGGMTMDSFVESDTVEPSDDSSASSPESETIPVSDLTASRKGVAFAWARRADTNASK